MKRKCYAKINLSLDSLYKRSDGYHEIDTIMARISLFDELTINRNETGEFLYQSNKPDLSKLEDNLVYRVWDMLKDRTDKPGVDVTLIKNIPIAAGLAGGSSDAAEMIKALNILWDLSLSKEQMMEIGASLGADIPYFFNEGPARARGIGDLIKTFDNNLDLNILLVNDGTQISSATIYKDLANYGHIDNETIVNKLEKGDYSAIFSFENVMENIIIKLYPHLQGIKVDLDNNGADFSLISGSGASIFAIFPDKIALDTAYINLKNKYDFVKKVELI